VREVNGSSSFGSFLFRALTESIANRGDELFVLGGVGEEGDRADGNRGYRQSYGNLTHEQAASTLCTTARNSVSSKGFVKNPSMLALISETCPLRSSRPVVRMTRD